MSPHASFVQMALQTVRLPADAHVIGEPVTVTQIHDPRLPYVGVLATCERGGARHEVSLAEVHFAPGSPGAIVVARYRAWLGLPIAVEVVERPRDEIASVDIALGQPVELIVLACKSNALRCRLLGSHREITLRTAVRDEIPGSIVTVVPTKQWTHARHPYLSGKVSSMRDDVSALGLAPLALRAEGNWDPDDEHWGEEGEPIAEWAEPIGAAGGPCSRWSRSCPGATPTTSTPIRSWRRPSCAPPATCAAPTIV